jgi:hypothetical protein
MMLVKDTIDQIYWGMYKFLMLGHGQAGEPDYMISVWRWREEQLVVAAR